MPAIVGSAVWGHDTGVTESNVRDFSGNWTGTGSVAGAGDAERIILNAGEYMESEVVNTGTVMVSLGQNVYDPTGEDVLMYYRTAATEGGITSEIWLFYAGVFDSAGYVQIRLEVGLSLLAVSADGRSLEDAHGTPFLMIGDSPQGMLVCLTPAEMDTWFTARAGQGFNCTQVHVIGGTTFGGNADRSTRDSIDPFTTPADISTPNPVYFARLDALLSIALQNNIYVMLTAAEYIDSGAMWQSEGNSKCYAFGQYLGARYRNYPNVIWNVGNDFQDWESNAAARNAVFNVMDGLANQDPNHLHTAWLHYLHSGSRESTDWDNRVDVDFGYTYYPTYDIILEERARTPAKPVFLGEANYENESLRGYLTTPLILRRQHYWAMTSGACGVTYMNEQYDLGVADWETDLTNPGALQVAHIVTAFGARRWYDLAPDTTHTVLTAGYGTYAGDEIPGEINTNDYATCASLADGSLAMIYMPTNRTMTVDMTEFSGTVTARWFDPTDGSYTADAASPLSNTGTHNFSRASANADGDADWLLVLEA